jgi:hypothetical protein
MLPKMRLRLVRDSIAPDVWGSPQLRRRPKCFGRFGPIGPTITARKCHVGGLTFPGERASVMLLGMNSKTRPSKIGGRVHVG